MPLKKCLFKLTYVMLMLADSSDQSPVETSLRRPGQDFLLVSSKIHWSPSELSFVVVVELLICVQIFATPWTAAHQVSLSVTISLSLLRFMSIESMMLSNHLILCCSHLLLSIFPSIKVFSRVDSLHHVTKVSELQPSVLPMNIQS